MTNAPDFANPPTRPLDGNGDFAAGMRKARELYEDAVRSLRRLAGQALHPAPGGDPLQLAQGIATLLHNLSGTAGHFGDAELGELLRSLEEPTRSASTTAALQPCCRAILAALDRR